MRQHADDFMPFLPSVAGEDASGAGDDGMMTEQGFQTYCERVVSSGDWGGEPEVSLTKPR
jgi:OTU domain-containing protein 6